jgi:hypothetical protein
VKWLFDLKFRRVPCRVATNKTAPFASPHPNRSFCVSFRAAEVRMEEFAQAIVIAAYEEIEENGHPQLKCFHVGCDKNAVVTRSEMELFEELGESLLIDPDAESFAASTPRYYCEDHQNLADLDVVRCRNFRKVIVSLAWLKLAKPEDVADHVTIAKKNLKNFKQVLNSMEKLDGGDKKIIHYLSNRNFCAEMKSQIQEFQTN